MQQEEELRGAILLGLQRQDATGNWLHGPCASFETACSASLVAAHFAARALQHFECSMHLAAGINLMLLPAACVGCAVAGMTSARGRCHTFDGRADGFARADGCSGIFGEVGHHETVVIGAGCLHLHTAQEGVVEVGQLEQCNLGGDLKQLLEDG